MLDALLELPERAFQQPRAVARVAAPLEQVLQAYKARAVGSGQTFGHTVMLEAAVQGWCTPFH